MRLRSDDVPIGAVVAVTVDGEEYVVWRGHTGSLGSAPRACPHLDSDLTEARIVGDELRCAAHGWSFDCHGRAFKRNELGRVDPKDDVAALHVQEVDGSIELAR